MKRDQQTYEQIEQYLAKELAGEALSLFEEAMAVDEDLRNEVALQRSVHKLLGDQEVHALENALLEARKAHESPKVVKMFPYRKLGLIAAALLGLVLVYLGFFREQSLTNTDLYEAYYEVYPADIISRSDIDSLPASTMEIALKAYDNERYDEAYKAFGLIVPANSRVRFYMGLSKLELNSYENALELLVQVVTDGTSVYQEPAKWYQALALIQLDRAGEAREILTELSRAASGKYQKLATDLIESMD